MSNSQKYIFSFVNAFMYLSFHYVHTNTPFDHTAKSWLVQITVKKKKKNFEHVRKLFYYRNFYERQTAEQRYVVNFIYFHFPFSPNLTTNLKLKQNLSTSIFFPHPLSILYILFYFIYILYYPSSFILSPEKKKEIAHIPSIYHPRPDINLITNITSNAGNAGPPRSKWPFIEFYRSNSHCPPAYIQYRSREKLENVEQRRIHSRSCETREPSNPVSRMERNP